MIVNTIKLKGNKKIIFMRITEKAYMKSISLDIEFDVEEVLKVRK